MSVFYVFQGETYKQERKGGYVWSPQLNKSGRKNPGYTMMTNIRKGDFILHNSNSKVLSISIAKEDCYEADQPNELVVAKTSTTWNKKGYRVDTVYFDFDVPLKVTDYKEWFKAHYQPDSAFTVEGLGKTQYMCHLTDEHAIFLLEKVIGLQKKSDTRNHLKNALADIIGEKESEYDPAEMETINDLVDNTETHQKPTWSGKREKQAMTTSPNTGRKIPKRDPKRAADALEYADYLCEFNPSDRTFLRKNGNAYTEPHHLIPISKYKDFNYSVDVMENIVSLCSHCHNLLHYGRLQDKIPILTKLYNERKDALHACGLDLTLDQLISYYK